MSAKVVDGAVDGVVTATPRPILRVMQARDRPAMMAQFADAEVMRYLLPVPDDAACDATIARVEGYARDRGYTFWSVEIGWRLARDAWGQGYAREAAEATLAWAWASTDAVEIVAITVPDDVASRTLIERIGMARVEGADFDHPLVADGSPLKRHILYKIGRPT